MASDPDPSVRHPPRRSPSDGDRSHLHGGCKLLAGGVLCGPCPRPTWPCPRRTRPTPRRWPRARPLPSGLNPFAPGFYDDPYVQYRHLRETEPVHHSPLGLWFLSRWDDCHHVLRLPGTSVDERNSVLEGRNEALEQAARDRGARRSKSILGTDPPDHTRIRKLVSKAFTPRTISRLEGRVAEVVDDRLDAAAAVRRPRRPHRRAGLPAALPGHPRDAGDARHGRGRAACGRCPRPSPRCSTRCWP